MASAQLPNETLNAIFQNLSPASLTAVVRASHRFRLVAERILYTNIIVTDSLPRNAPTPSNTGTCATTILARPHLAELVRKFSIRWHTDPGTREEYIPIVAPVLQVLNRALRTLSHLEHLDLAFALIGAPLDARIILEGCLFPALRLFALSGVGRGSLSPKLVSVPSAPIAWFLTDTPSIEHLHLLDCYETLDLPEGSLPALQVFRGSAIAAASVLPGRPVRLLGLVGHEFITERDLHRIAASSVPIRWLDLSMMSVTPLLLRDISRHLHAVEVLKVKLALRHTLHFALSGIYLTSSFLPSPTSLLSLSAPNLPHPEPPRRALSRARRVPRPAPARPLPDARRRRRARERARGERALHDVGARVPRPQARRLSEQDRVAARRRGGHLGRGGGRDGMDAILASFGSFIFFFLPTPTSPSPSPFRAFPPSFFCFVFGAKREHGCRQFFVRCLVSSASPGRRGWGRPKGGWRKAGEKGRHELAIEGQCRGGNGTRKGEREGLWMTEDRGSPPLRSCLHDIHPYDRTAA